MENESTERNFEHEQSQDESSPGRFKYFLDQDPVAIVDEWNTYSDRVVPDFEEQHPDLFRDAEMVCEVLANELRQLAQEHPYRAAEIVAEVARREDGSFLLASGVGEVILYIAASTPNIATETWGIIRELATKDDREEILLEMEGHLRAITGHPSRPDAVTPRSDVDRVSMVLFFIEHIRPSPSQ